jgi:hypothetical protein
MSAGALRNRLEVVSASHPALDRVATCLTRDAEAAWSDVGAPRPVRWPALVRQFVLPVLEPLRTRLTGDELLGVLRGQLAFLVLGRVLDDVRDHAADPGAATRAAWDASTAASACGLRIDRSALGEALGARSEVVDPTGSDGSSRAWFLELVPKGMRAPADWLAAWSSLLALSIVLDDVEDAVDDLAAGRATWVTGLLASDWSPADVGAGVAVADRLDAATRELCGRVLAVEARWPLLAATVAAMAPAQVSLARATLAAPS